MKKMFDEKPDESSINQFDKSESAASVLGGAQALALDDAFLLARLNNECCRLTKEHGLYKRNVLSILANLSSSGYTIEEKIYLLQSITHKEDAKLFTHFKTKPISYVAVFSCHSALLSTKMLMALVQHMGIFQRKSSTFNAKAIKASFAFFNFAQLDSFFTAQAATGTHSFYPAARKFIIDESRSLIFKDRFTAFPLRSAYEKIADTYTVASSTSAALTTMRLMLNDSYFTSTELKHTQNLFSAIKKQQKRFAGFPIVIGKALNGHSTFYFGGNQAWFEIAEKYAAAYGGCGAVAAANIFATLAFKDLGAAKRLGYPVWFSSKIATMGEFLTFMQDVYETVKPLEIPFSNKPNMHRPSSLGIISRDYFILSMIEYAAAHNLVLVPVLYNRFIKEPYQFEKIRQSLNKNIPIAFLNLWTTLPIYRPNGTLLKKYNRHWVTIMGYEKDKLIISSWGNEYYINYKDMVRACRTNPLGFANSMLCFELMSYDKLSKNPCPRKSCTKF